MKHSECFFRFSTRSISKESVASKMLKQPNFCVWDTTLSMNQDVVFLGVRWCSKICCTKHIHMAIQYHLAVLTSLSRSHFSVPHMTIHGNILQLHTFILLNLISFLAHYILQHLSIYFYLHYKKPILYLPFCLEPPNTSIYWRMLLIRKTVSQILSWVYQILNPPLINFLKEVLKWRIPTWISQSKYCILFSMHTTNKYSK